MSPVLPKRQPAPRQPRRQASRRRPTGQPRQAEKRVRPRATGQPARPEERRRPLAARRRQQRRRRRRERPSRGRPGHTEKSVCARTRCPTAGCFGNGGGPSVGPCARRAGSRWRQIDRTGGHDQPAVERGRRRCPRLSLEGQRGSNPRPSAWAVLAGLRRERTG